MFCYCLLPLLLLLLLLLSLLLVVVEIMVVVVVRCLFVCLRVVFVLLFLVILFHASRALKVKCKRGSEPQSSASWRSKPLSTEPSRTIQH